MFRIFIYNIYLLCIYFLGLTTRFHGDCLSKNIGMSESCSLKGRMRV